MERGWGGGGGEIERVVHLKFITQLLLLELSK